MCGQLRALFNARHGLPRTLYESKCVTSNAPRAQLDPVIGLMLRLLPDRDEAPESPQAIRRQFDRLIKFTHYRGAGTAGGIEDLVLDGGLAGRLYRPSFSGTVPTIVFFHGGGWVVGTLDGYDSQCKRLRDGTGAAVLSVAYRLAPESPFPGPVEDAITATRWAVRNVGRLGGDATRIAVAGDSAGANLAAVVAQTLREEVKLAGQLLIYPATDSVGLRSGEATARFPSHGTFASGYFLTLERMKWYADRYIPSEDDRHDPRASPLRAEDLSGVAPAVIATAGFDPLLDEGRAYAEKLRAAGVPVTYLEFATLVHGYFALATFSPGARRAAAATCAAFKDLLGSANGARATA
jgi:acetyl esterase